MSQNYLGDKIRSIREQAKLSQEQIANFLGIDQSLISRFENNERQINLEYIERICSLCGCSLPDLVREENPRSNLSFAFRSNNITPENLQDIAEINQIALNLIDMQHLLKNHEY